MAIPFLDLAAQYRSLKTELDAAILETIGSCHFILGPEVEQFEKDFAAYCHVPHCLGVSNGTSALEMILRAHGIGPGDEVITAANTFFATVEAISMAGATPVLVDCNEDDALIDVSKIEAAITAKTKAIMPVHLYGQCADMDPILALAAKHNLLVFEDCAQAHGALYKGRVAGSMGVSSGFSFYPGKNLGAYGDAGAVVTKDAEVAKRIKALREHGSLVKYHHEYIGRNERMDGVQGAVLGIKLKHLPEWNAERLRHAQSYRELLANVPGVRTLTQHADRVSVYHLFIVVTEDRDGLQQFLKEQGIATGIHYPVPVHLQPAYAGFGWMAGQFPVAERLGKHILSLPMFAELQEAQVREVASAVTAFLKKSGN